VGEARDALAHADVVEESRTSNVIFQVGGPSGRRKGSEVPMKPGNALAHATVPGEGRTLTSGVLVKEERSGDWR
jgi:hypothetical protein